MLDEAQLVPIDYLSPILKTMELLRSRYRVTFVISTATQPAVESREGFKGFPVGSIHKIISDVPKLYRELKRVEMETPHDWQIQQSWEDIAKEIECAQRVLCVVSDRKSCRDLYRLLPKDTYHLFSPDVRATPQ